MADNIIWAIFVMIHLKKLLFVQPVLLLVRLGSVLVVEQSWLPIFLWLHFFLLQFGGTGSPLALGWPRAWLWALSQGCISLQNHGGVSHHDCFFPVSLAGAGFVPSRALRELTGSHLIAPASLAPTCTLSQDVQSLAHASRPSVCPRDPLNTCVDLSSGSVLLEWDPELLPGLQCPRWSGRAFSLPRSPCSPAVLWLPFLPRLTWHPPASRLCAYSSFSPDGSSPHESLFRCQLSGSGSVSPSVSLPLLCSVFCISLITTQYYLIIFLCSIFSTGI